MKTKLVLAGGFLGAGKTTLLKEAARRLTLRGESVGLITNDQAAELVDTAMLSGSGVGVREVAGSCFCCDFAGLEAAMHSLAGQGASIILAEPVGSCTDLAATIIQPMKDRLPGIGLAPLTVLCSPGRVREALGKSPSALHDNALYILGLQMAESDCLLLSKTDLLAAAERESLLGLLRAAFPDKDVSGISARSAEDIDAWLDRILSGTDAGTHIVDVDYDRYAEGEAVLGWLNATIGLRAAHGEADFLEPTLDLMRSIHRQLRASNPEIGHIKALVESGGSQRLANLTSLNAEITAPDATALRGSEARIILNARVQMPSAALEEVGRRAIASLEGRPLAVTTTAFHCLTPGRPQPAFRYQAKPKTPGA